MKIKKKVLIRTDGSKRLGLGHIIRCLGLAQELKRNGFECIFFTKYRKSQVLKTIEFYHFPVRTFRAKNFHQDLMQSLKFIKNKKIDIVITDLGNDETAKDLLGYEKYLKGLKEKSNIFLVTLDELFNIDFASDLLINPNLGASRKKYKSKKPVYLLGPKYFIFRDELIELAKMKKIKDKAKNILISLGGFRHSIIKKINQVLKNFPGISVKIAPSKKKENFAKLLLWADIGIMAGGFSKYEAALFGLPAIIISIVPHQDKLMQLFKKAKTCIYLGFYKEISPDGLKNRVKNLIDNYQKRCILSKNGKRLIDGEEKKRVVKEILKILRQKIYGKN